MNILDSLWAEVIQYPGVFIAYATVAGVVLYLTFFTRWEEDEPRPRQKGRSIVR